MGQDGAAGVVMLGKYNRREKKMNPKSFEEYDREHDFRIMKGYVLAFVISTILWFIVFMLCCKISHAENIPDGQAIRAIIGEASNQGYEGMLAVACAIRNRGTLKGVYGVNAKHIDKEPKYVWDMAKMAWAASAVSDVTNSATHWEAVKKYGKPKWAEKMKLTLIVKDHYFYREVRK
jgi:hypothetical protein